MWELKRYHMNRKQEYYWNVRLSDNHGVYHVIDQRISFNTASKAEFPSNILINAKIVQALRLTFISLDFWAPNFIFLSLLFYHYPSKEQTYSFYRTQVSLGSDLWVWAYVRHWQDYFEDLTDVTLADEDSNSIPTDGVNRAFLSNMATQEAPPGGQNWN